MAIRGAPARRRVCWCLSMPVAMVCAGTLALAALTPTPATAAGTAMPRIGVHGARLYAGPRPWKAWGMNWGIGDHAPVIAYFDDPSPADLAVLQTELRTARAMGANSMRIYLQLAQVMATPTHPRQRTLTALQRLLALAQHERIYLDITGDLVWQTKYAPGWYRQLPYQTRWQ